MNLNKFLIASAVAMLAAGGCAIEEIGGTPEEVGAAAPKISAELYEPVTRTCINDAEVAVGGKLPVLWMPEDKIGVFFTGSKNVCYTNDEESENVPNTTFSSTEYVSGEMQYAYYPYDSANDGKSASSLSGSIPSRQTMDQALEGDYKYGIPVSGSAVNGYRFKFHNLFSLVRFNVDATGTEFAGKTLESVTLTVTRKGAAVPLTGSFTFDAEKGTYKLGSTTNSLMTVWNQILDGELTSFASVFPQILIGDQMTFVLGIDGKSVKFTVTSAVEFKPETYYNFPLKLKGFNYTVSSLPTMSALEFKAADNEGKLLPKQTLWDSDDHEPYFADASYKVSFADNHGTLMIPYLYDFKLVPNFTVSSGAKVTVNGQEVVSGQSVIDFSLPVTFTVTSSDGWRDYVVTVTNTGLPIVVLKHSSSGSFSKEYIGGVNIFGGNIGGTLVNEFVDFMIRGKNTDWVEDDQMTVYKPDGTVDMETTTCGARLRGNTSRGYPKKPFAIKLTSKRKILGMPSHKRWVLLANWLDHSMIRNAVAFDIAHAIEDAWRNNTSIDPGVPWNVHGRSVELIVYDKNGNGHHVGNYYLCEQIKIDGGRLDIQDPYKKGENEAYETCGYLFEIDDNYDETSQFKTTKSVPVMFKDEVSSTILNTVKTKIQGIETNIYNGAFSTAYNSLDINSVIDQWLVFELAMNREYGDPRSVYMFMDGDGKLSGGPVWDFDRGTFQNYEGAKALGNTDSYRLKPHDKWICLRTQESESDSYIWYKKLIYDPIFQAKVRERWAVIHPELKKVSNKIREYGVALKASYEVDSKMWPTYKGDIREYKSDFNDWSGDEEIVLWQDVIDNFVTVYESRLAGMDALIKSENFVGQ